MHAVDKVKNLKDTVKSLLEKNSALRDNDKLLWYTIIYQIFGENLKLTNAFSFLREYSENNNIPSQDSVGRARRAIQDAHVELRGKNYKNRKKEEEIFTKEINKTDDKFVLRLFDMFDGWINIEEDLTKDKADQLYNKYTNNGTKNTKYSDGDYYKIFPSDTKMLITPENINR